MALAGGKSGRLVVIPTATTDDDWLTKPEALAAYIEGWKCKGIPSVTVLHRRDRTQANRPDFARPLTSATAVWFGGGDQALLEQTYVGTLVETEICGLLARGRIVGGSSAGAAIQSRVMIRAGDDVPEIGTGFGLVPNAIVDQHFLRRNRVNRLFEAVRAANVSSDYRDLARRGRPWGGVSQNSSPPGFLEPRNPKVLDLARLSGLVASGDVTNGALKRPLLRAGRDGVWAAWGHLENKCSRRCDFHLPSTVALLQSSHSGRS